MWRMRKNRNEEVIRKVKKKVGRKIEREGKWEIKRK